MEGRPAFLDYIANSARSFRAGKFDSVLLVHHNDADGLSSAATLLTALEREGAKVRRYCLEKPYPEVVDILLSDPPERQEAVIFADFASGMLDTLHASNKHGRPIFILDHHMIQGTNHPGITLINCLSFGIKSDPDCSASAIAASFALALSPENSDLCALAVVGSVGDGLVSRQGKLSGINQLHAEAASRRGDVSFSAGAYRLRSWPSASVQDLVQVVNLLGSAGYYRGGPDLAIKGLLAGESELCRRRAHEYELELGDALASFLKPGFLRQEGLLQWFVLEGSFAQFGVKTVGLVCEQLIRESRVNKQLYLAGLQPVRNEIPGLGSVALDQVKVSMRLPPELKQAVAAGALPPLTEVLPPATRSVGGFVDACHAHAAATTIPRGQEASLIKELVNVLDRYKAA